MWLRLRDTSPVNLGDDRCRYYILHDSLEERAFSTVTTGTVLCPPSLFLTVIDCCSKFPISLFIQNGVYI